MGDVSGENLETLEVGIIGEIELIVEEAKLNIKI
jgi:hypothetical protein